MIFIKVKNYKNIIKECFSTDSELLNKWHIESGQGLDKCVERTYTDLMELGNNLTFYKIVENNKLVGFLGKEKFYNTNALTSFFIVPKARNKKLMGKFWNLVNYIFDNERFLCGIYSKNTRALNFLLKNNGKILMNTDDNMVLEFNRKEI